jgi:hypothetical protein
MHHIVTHRPLRVASTAVVGLLVFISINSAIAYGNENPQRNAPATSSQPGKLPKFDKARENMEKNRNVRNQLIDEQTEERLKNQALQEGARGKMGMQKAEIADMFMNRIVQRLSDHIARMKNIADRLETRIEKLETRNINVDESKRLVNDARIKISGAETDIASLKSVISSRISSTTATSTVKNPIKEIRTIAAESLKKIREAHEALVKAIRSINAKLKTDKPQNNTSTTTATTTSTTSTNR